MTRHSNSAGRRTGPVILVLGAIALGLLAGCQESVVIAFYDALEELVVAMVQAYFEAIKPTASTTASAAGLIDSIPQWLG